MTAKKKRVPATPTSASKKKKPAPPPKPAPTPATPTPHRYSALDAAVLVLRETGQPMSCPELIEQMAAKGYWTSPQGKTPSSTLYAAIGREIKLKGAASRFVQTGPGRFAARDGGNS
jgi:HB1/ASXL restriction endonuclease-like protein with HTH domain